MIKLFLTALIAGLLLIPCFAQIAEDTTTTEGDRLLTTGFTNANNNWSGTQTFDVINLGGEDKTNWPTGEGSVSNWANYIALRDVDMGGFALTNILYLDFDGDHISIGQDADGEDFGFAIGYEAVGTNTGMAIGYQANGANDGIAIGRNPNGFWQGIAIGFLADGSYEGISIGQYANSFNQGISIGRRAYSVDHGVAIGRYANAVAYSVALGYAVTNLTPGTTRIKGALDMVTNSIILGGEPRTNWPTVGTAEQGTYPIFKLDVGLVEGLWTEFEIKGSTNNFDTLLYYYQSWTNYTASNTDTNAFTYYTDDCSDDSRVWRLQTNGLALSEQFANPLTVIQSVYFMPSHNCSNDWSMWMHATNTALVWSWVRGTQAGYETNAFDEGQRWSPIRPQSWDVERITP